MNLFTRFSVPEAYRGLVRCEKPSELPSVCDPSGTIDLKTQIKILLNAGESLEAYRRLHYRDFDFPDGAVDDEMVEKMSFPSDESDELVSDVASRVLSVLHANRLARRQSLQVHQPSADAHGKGAESASSSSSTGKPSGLEGAAETKGRDAAE